ncbi:MAG: hypothetical protein WEE50_02105 [Chloroflexota bacterium]
MTFGLVFRPLGLPAVIGVASVALVAACSPAPTPPPPTRVPVALAPIEVMGVGEFRQGTTSADDLVIRFTELENDAIPRGPGAFELVLTDSAGTLDAVSFRGTPTLAAPGSLGVTATLTRSNVLTVQIVDSDTLNIEPVTIEGLALSARVSASTGPLVLTIGGCSGSLAGCASSDVLASPGTVVAGS